MMDSVTGGSPRQLARIAGALYLINIVGGAFAIGFVRAALFTPRSGNHGAQHPDTPAAVPIGPRGAPSGNGDQRPLGADLL